MCIYVCKKNALDIIGEDCSVPCPAGFYGNQCKHPCNCSSNEKCNPFAGCISNSSCGKFKIDY